MSPVSPVPSDRRTRPGRCVTRASEQAYERAEKYAYAYKARNEYMKRLKKEAAILEIILKRGAFSSEKRENRMELLRKKMAEIDLQEYQANLAAVNCAANMDACLLLECAEFFLSMKK